MPEGFQRLQIGDTISVGDTICLTTDFTSDNFEYLVNLTTNGVNNNGISLTATPAISTTAIPTLISGGFSLIDTLYDKEYPLWLDIWTADSYYFLMINLWGTEEGETKGEVEYSSEGNFYNSNLWGDCYISLNESDSQELNSYIANEDSTITSAIFNYMTDTSDTIRAFEDYLLPFLCIKHNS